MADISMHTLAIAALRRANPAIQVDGFAAAIRRLIRDEASTERDPADRAAAEAQLLVLWKRCMVIPDGYVLRYSEEIGGPELTIYEVEDSSKITLPKMLKLAHLWWLLDAICGDLVVIVLDRYGQNPRTIDVRGWESEYWRATDASTPQPVGEESES